MHLFGFIIRIFHGACSPERQILKVQFMTFSTGEVPFVNMAKRNPLCVRQRYW